MKPMKQYTSFEEIDRDLRILKLQREIDREQLKLTVQETRNSLYPTNLLGGMSGILQKILASLLVKKLLKRFS